MILLIAVKAEAVFKITAPLAGSYRKGIEPAGPWACLVDAAQPILQENTGIVRPRGFQHEDGKALLGQRHRLAVSGQHIVYSADVGITATQIVCQPVGIQALHHQTILDMTAALSTPAALVVHTVFGMNGHYYCFLIIHDNPPKKGPWREIRHGPKHIGQALLSRYLLTTALRACGQTHHRERVAGRQRKRGH